MARIRKTVYPELADYFQGLRKRRGWDQSEAANIAERKGLTGITYQALRGLERGETQRPTERLLRDIATLYRVPYESVAAAFIKQAFGLSLQVTANGRLLPITAAE